MLSTNMKKVAEVARAPLFSNFSEIFNGASIVKSFGIQKKVRKDFELNMDQMLCSDMHIKLTENYNFFRSEQYGALMSIFTALSIVLMRIIDIEFFIDQKRMALALSYVIIITGWVSTNIFSMSRFMKGIASLERVLHWTDSQDLEAALEKKTDPEEGSWPLTGKIEGKNLTARYRENLPRVLKGLDFKVNDKEKIGVVGRTGSGKSTLILSLMRILEQDEKESPLEPESQIVIDSKVIGDLGLNVSRKAITLIP